MNCINIIMDLSKAFECIEHELPLYQLIRYGIQEKTLKLGQQHIWKIELIT